MHFSLIIPVFNGGKKIVRTIDSALRQTSVQSGVDTVSIHVVDGASSDDTVDNVRSFEDARIRITSEADSGMYDALSKGLVEASEDVTCYLPAGEVFDAHAFSIVSDIFSNHPGVHWLTGRAVARNEHGQIIDSLLPHPFRRRLFQCGMYGTRLIALQQESTFWRTELNNLVDIDKLRCCKLAGDYLLWKSMSSRHELYVVNTHLSAFSVEDGQLSQQVPGAYRNELRSLRREPALWEQIYAFLLRKKQKLFLASPRAKRQFRYDTEQKRWNYRR